MSKYYINRKLTKMKTNRVLKNGKQRGLFNWCG